MVNIFDTVHGYIPFTSLEAKFIDNRWVKRLKRVKQLGLLDHVFPSASHSRFEHSLGVAYLGEKYVNALRINSLNFKPSETDILCVKLAGLFHDLGHGPFSHVFDNHVLKPNSIKHEQRSRNIVEYIFSDIGTSAELNSAYVIDTIKNMIEPDEGSLTPQTTSPIMNIVNNKINNIDVDKFDYLQRDPNHIGLDYSFNHERIFNKSRIVDNAIVYDPSIASNIENLFITRHRFHKDIYNHKTVKLIEAMLSDALNYADPVYQFDKIIQTENYLSLDDSIYTQILFSNDSKLKKSKDILSRIESRDLYKLLWIGNVDDETGISISDELFPDINPDNIKQVNMKFNLCNGINSPLDRVQFISTSQSYTNSSSIIGSHYSLSNGKFEENTIMLYSIN